MDDNEPFSNPIAPAHELKSGPTTAIVPQKESHPLTNDDFRKLMMTPRAGASGSMAPPQSVRGGSVAASVRGHRKPVLSQEQNENKSKKKKLFQAMKKEEEDQLAELAARYRDRARERRDGANPDYQSEDPMASIPAYRAVAPDVKSLADAAERRKQMIEESKFLGGDMAHTHLVKGLDYALLQKVKAEITTKDGEDEPDDDHEDEDAAGLPELPDVPDQEVWEVKSVMAKNIINLIEQKRPERNELFLPSRMAYVVELEDECADDIPTTIIRSRADCPNWDSLTTLSTNDIVINKLTQILSYLRQGGGAKKKKKEKIPFIDESVKDKSAVKQDVDDLDGGIYGEDVGDYKPNYERKERSQKESDLRDKGRYSERERRKGSYFEKPSLVEKETVTSSSRVKPPETKTDRQSFSTHSKILPGVSTEEAAKVVRAKLSTLDAPDSYAECYPGAPENDDAILDSDDEVDYTKMDMGNKKGTVNRWDFDTAEEYGDYMSNKEAMPKAAYQFGLKMADGRKTRGKPAKKDNKAKEERDYQKVFAIMDKRKNEAAESAPKLRFQTPAHQPSSKRQKH